MSQIMGFHLWSKAKKMNIGNGPAKAVYLYLATCQNEKSGQCNPSQKRIALETEMCLNTIKSAIKFLENNSYITKQIDRNGSRVLGSVYTINLKSNGASPDISSPDISSPDISSPDDSMGHLVRVQEMPPNKNKEEENKKENKKERKASSSVAEKQITRADIKNDSDWMTWLADQKKYQHLDVKKKYQDLLDWCGKKEVTPTRLRLITWLNKDLGEVPIITNNGNSHFSGCDTCRNDPNRSMVSLKTFGWVFDPIAKKINPCKCKTNGST